MAATILYVYPVSGATAPTAAQALTAQMLTATVQFGDNDTVAVITHNWGAAGVLVSRYPTGTLDLANLFPIPIVYPTGSTVLTTAPNVTIALTNTNAVTLGKAAAAGSGCTYNVVLLLPHTLIR